MTQTQKLEALVALVALVPTLAFAGDVKVDGKFVSTVPTGTPPLQVDSTTLVPNLNAELLNGLPASAFTTSVANVVRVGKAGADFTSIQAAIDSITDAGLDNWYVVTVGPGVYNESVTLKSFVSVLGHEFPATRIEVEGAGSITAVQGAALSVLTDVWVVARSTDGGDATGVSGPIPRIEGAVIQAETSSLGDAVAFRAQDFTTIIDSQLEARDGNPNAGILMSSGSEVEMIGGRVRAESFGNPGATNRGVHNPGDGGVDLVEVDVSVGGGSVGYGVHFVGTGNTGRCDRCRISGEGSTASAGLKKEDTSSLHIVDSIIDAGDVGVDADGGIVAIRRSDLSGVTAVDLAAGAVANLGYDQVVGFLSGAGDYECIGLHSPSMSPVNCPSP